MEKDRKENEKLKEEIMVKKEELKEQIIVNK